ncbi:reverse transcriptase-like protein [Brevibacillus centrosporus]|jgi:ribonuclease HI|uniref:ribonuclease HI family protein n=1 Tax=Brevibacillus centrosporus TaxID=54910 RepID=UPI0039858B4B
MYLAFSDGYAHRPSGQASVAYLIIKDEKVVSEHATKIGKASIHEAEYQAILTTMQKLISLGVREACIYSDDALAVNQINEAWLTLDEKLKPLLEEVSRLKSNFDTISFSWIPEEENSRVSSQSKKCFTVKPRPYTGYIERTGPFQFLVKGDHEYVVDLVMSTCTCPAYRNRSTVPCKHILFVREQDPAMDFEIL